MTLALNNIVHFAAGAIALVRYPDLDAEDKRAATAAIFIGLTELLDGDSEAVIRRTTKVHDALANGGAASLNHDLVDATIVLTLVAANGAEENAPMLPRLQDLFLNLLQRESGLDDEAFRDLFAAQGLDLRIEPLH